MFLFFGEVGGAVVQRGTLNDGSNRLASAFAFAEFASANHRSRRADQMNPDRESDVRTACDGFCANVISMPPAGLPLRGLYFTDAAVRERGARDGRAGACFVEVLERRERGERVVFGMVVLAVPYRGSRSGTSGTTSLLRWHTTVNTSHRAPSLHPHHTRLARVQRATEHEVPCRWEGDGL